MLLELAGLRYGSASTIFCAQFKKSDWHARLDGVHADAIMDRIVHNAVWLYMGEENMRKGMAERGIRRPVRPPDRDIAGSVPQWSAALKRANTQTKTAEARATIMKRSLDVRNVHYTSNRFCNAPFRRM